MAQIEDEKVTFLISVEVAKKDTFQNCISFLAALSSLCYSHNIDIRQPATGAILSTEDKRGKTEY